MAVRALLFLAACVAGVALISAQPADSEGASLSYMPEYVQWVTQNCGDPAKVTDGPCKALKDKMCGTRDTAEVLCLNGNNGPEARFKSASRYTRVAYLACSLTVLKCTTSSETYNGPARSVDPVSLAAWVTYINKCTTLRGPQTTPASVCVQLTGAHCSRADVRCSKDAAEFFDISDVCAKKVVLKADNTRGLVFLK